MTENMTLSALRRGDELRFHGLRLGRGPILTRVRCCSECFLICDYQIGGVDRHQAVDLKARRRWPVPAGRCGDRESTNWCRDLLDDLEAGRGPVSEVALPMDVVASVPAA